MLCYRNARFVYIIDLQRLALQGQGELPSFRLVETPRTSAGSRIFLSNHEGLLTHESACRHKRLFLQGMEGELLSNPMCFSDDAKTAEKPVIYVVFSNSATWQQDPKRP